MNGSHQPFDPAGPLPLGTTLLEASAGTGKTYSITGLVVRLVVEENVTIDKILAVTFTNLATAELTRKIRERLNKAYLALSAAAARRPDGAGLPSANDHRPATDDDPTLAHIVATSDHDVLTTRAERARQAIESFDKAPIATIHGFCQRILQRHALEAGVGFDVELLESSQELVEEIAEDFWVNRVHDADELDLDALDALGVSLRDLKDLTRTAIAHWSAKVVPPRPQHAAAPDPALTRRVQAALAAVAPLLGDHGEEALAEVGELCAHDWTGPGYAPGTYAFADARRAIDKIGGHKLSPRLVKQLFLLDRSWLDKHFQGVDYRHAALFDAVQELVVAYRAWIPAARPWALALRHDLVAYARAEAERRTGRRRVWTFDDLLRQLDEALAPGSATRARLQDAVGGQYQAVFIDEFQDTDPVQWRIFEALFGTPRHRLYLIGDPKQAIYRFRRADIRTYLSAQQHANHRFSLEKNYRSDIAVVDVVNDIFSARNPAIAKFSFGVAGIDFHPSSAAAPERRLCGGGGATPALRVLQIARSPENTGAAAAALRKSEIKREWAKRHLPEIVAADIGRVLASGLTIKRKNEDGSSAETVVGPQDIAVLVRTNEQALAMREALREHHIPGIVHGPQSVYETDEATELLRILKAVLEPARTRTVRAALVTRVMGYPAEALAKMDLENPRALEEPVRRFRDWQSIWMKYSFIQMFRQIASDATDRLLALQFGERRLANLLHLGELLHHAAADKELKPAGLLQFLERQRQRPDERDERQQLRLETDEPAVQIVTIHKAKGLEYELVWLPFVWESSGLRWDEKRDLVFRDPDDRYAVTLDIGVDDDDAQRKTHMQHGEHEVQTEQLRLLYVALTRAKLACTIAWGKFAKIGRSALAYLLYSSRRAASAGALELAHKEASERVKNLTDHDLMAPFRGLGPDVALVTEPPPDAATEGGALPWRPAVATNDLAARAWQRTTPLDLSWRRTSFSGLTAELVETEQILQNASDEDALPSEHEAMPVVAAEDTPRLLLQALPAGRSVGNALHKVLELCEFDTTRAALEPIVVDELGHHAVHGPNLGTVVSEALLEVLATPLPGTGFRLKDVPREARLPELAFVFPVRTGNASGFSIEALVEAFRAFSRPMHKAWVASLSRLRFESLRGFLSGSIDLAFRGPDGRFYLLDWKSNRLGHAHVAAEYAPERLVAAMDLHHYHLQYHLYTIALSRYLARRLGPSWSYERDFGGVFYCFLRGMSPSHPPGYGVFYDRPPAALVTALDHAFGAAS